ncbi:hypothetical protein XU18_3127 [Perkinsela sp. CCAP 1560/4]|nr:hypothetical protein XU18_3127 [Perkinsela sp. CCAP 1560/4]|eukprot:KNH05965.1 hypothetical protein XU18_3127 [Perkinsela sp. CCAP 1560/4]
MEKLNFGFSALTGPIGLEGLPEGMKEINVCHNKFCGSLKLESLPDTLTEFNAWSNQFSGSVDLIRLPPALIYLDVSANQLSADPTEVRLFVVGQDQYPSMGRFRKPPLVAMGSRILLVARRENVHSFSVD